MCAASGSALMLNSAKTGRISATHGDDVWDGLFQARLNAQRQAQVGQRADRHNKWCLCLRRSYNSRSGS